MSEDDLPHLKVSPSQVELEEFSAGEEEDEDEPLEQEPKPKASIQVAVQPRSSHHNELGHEHRWYSDDEVADKLQQLVNESITLLSQPTQSDSYDLFSILLDTLILPSCHLIRGDMDMEIIAEEILSHTRIEDDADDVLRLLVSLFQGLKLDRPDGDVGVEQGYVYLSFIYYLGKMTLANTYRRLAELDGLELLKPVILNYSNHRLHGPAVKLMYEICQVGELGLSELGEIDETLVVAVLDKIETTSTDEAFEEELNALVKLILSFNNQFQQKNHARTIIKNQVISALASRLHLGKKLGETVIMIFNRAASATVQRLLIRFIFIIFTTSETANFFYTNDLKVILDVILRESRAVAEEDEELQQGYLSILPPLLKHAGQRGYKRRDVLGLLTELRRGSSSSPSSPTRSPMDAPFPSPIDLNPIGVRSSTRRVADQVFADCRNLLCDE
ncbi:hypothetical protein HDU97_002773 [Phlyctochytrium planicorne]|nr:hypothetical protein HDU97_002773 [Phlyctochytrium planicorne]